MDTIDKGTTSRSRSPPPALSFPILYKCGLLGFIITGHGPQVWGCRSPDLLKKNCGRKEEQSYGSSI